MGKTQVESHSHSRKLESKQKKNISKKDSDKYSRIKKNSKQEKLKTRVAMKEKERALNKAQKTKSLHSKRREEEKEDEDWEDVDEHEKDVFDKDGYFDVPDELALIS
jgi:hypothetical protein